MSRLLAPLFALTLLLSASIALAVGERPQDFRLNQLAGPPITLSDHLGEKVILMSFWATWCSPCKAEMPHFQSLHDRYSEHGLMVLGVNTDEARKLPEVRSEVNSRGLRYPILLDNNAEVFSVLNPSKTLPYAVVIGRDGTIHSVHVGYTPGDEVALEAELRGLLGLEPAAAGEAHGG